MSRLRWASAIQIRATIGVDDSKIAAEDFVGLPVRYRDIIVGSVKSASYDRDGIWCYAVLDMTLDIPGLNLSDLNGVSIGSR